MCTCTQCRRSLRKKNPSHSCVQASVTEHFRDRPARVRALYDALLERLSRLGSVGIDAVETAIHLRAKARFAAVFAQQRGLKLEFVLPYRIDDPRVTRVEQPTVGQWAHQTRVTGVSDLDGALIYWLGRAYVHQGGRLKAAARLRLGAHQSIAGGLHRALERGLETTCDVVQIFDKPSHQWRAPALPAAQVDRFRLTSERLGIQAVAAHASYLPNLASPDRGARRKSVRGLRVELDRCVRLGIPNLVVHPGFHLGSGEDVGLLRVAEGIRELLADVDDITLCIEMTAGQGTGLGHTFDHLARLVGVVDSDRLGVCLDTCHMFAAGYEFSRRAQYRRVMGDFESRVGIERLKVIHLNDSKNPGGTHKDRHEHIGDGHIGPCGFRHFLRDVRLRAIPMIIETPKHGDGVWQDRRNLALLRELSLGQGRRLPSANAN